MASLPKLEAALIAAAAVVLSFALPFALSCRLSFTFMPAHAFLAVPCVISINVFPAAWSSHFSITFRACLLWGDCVADPWPGLRLRLRVWLLWLFVDVG